MTQFVHPASRSRAYDQMSTRLNIADAGHQCCRKMTARARGGVRGARRHILEWQLT
jgi:hypothetical protein